MNRLSKVRAVILKRKNIGEADKLLTVLSENHGKIFVRAHGIRKIKSRRASHLELFNHVELTLYKRLNFYSVSDVETIESFPNIRVDIENVSQVFRIAEILDRLSPENQENRAIYQSLCTYLNTVNNPGNTDIKNFSEKIILNILWILGYLPEANKVPDVSLDSFIEAIIERSLKSRILLTKV